MSKSKSKSTPRGATARIMDAYAELRGDPPRFSAARSWLWCAAKSRGAERREYLGEAVRALIEVSHFAPAAKALRILAGAE